MTGQDDIIDLRRRGKVPAAVWIETAPATTRDDLRRIGRKEFRDGITPFAYLAITEEETVPRLDLRCLVGLNVHVEGEDEHRVGEVARACVEAKAKQVIACCGRWEDGWRYVVGRTTFTLDEVAQWP